MCPQQENKVKTAIVAMLLASAIASPASAGGFKIEKPCGTRGAERCIPPAPPPRPFTMAECCAVGTVRFVDHSKNNRSTYVSSSRMVINSNYGTSVIDSTYRSSSRY